MIHNQSFNNLFGTIFYLMPDGDAVFEDNKSGKISYIDKTLTDKKLSEIMKQSVSDNKNHLLHYLTKEYKQDCSVLY
ncbi:MAG: hypothetical protein KBS84_03585 [Treponema sp.]|nr:hypothetical protein [Candidatus Treponema scatequi]